MMEWPQRHCLMSATHMITTWKSLRKATVASDVIHHICTRVADNFITLGMSQLGDWFTRTDLLMLKKRMCKFQWVEEINALGYSVMCTIKKKFRKTKLSVHTRMCPWPSDRATAHCVNNRKIKCIKLAHNWFSSNAIPFSQFPLVKVMSHFSCLIRHQYVSTSSVFPPNNFIIFLVFFYFGSWLK